MPITAKEVIEIARDPKLRTIRFSVGPINVNASEYANVADYLEAGAVKVKPGGETYSLYYPQIDTLRTRRGDPPLDLNARTNMLHECTHIITDYNELHVTRLHDEVAAYLAQFAYLMILDPTVPKPPIGRGAPPINIMMSQGMDLVTKYRLNEIAGQGAMISQKDISDLANAIHAIPDYADIKEGELSAANGISLSDDEAETFLRLQLQRLVPQATAEDMRKEVEDMITTHAYYSAYENYVTADSELLTLFDSYRNGGGSQKKTATQKLLHIFLTIDQNNAVRLTQRLSALKKGDVVSERFYAAFPAPARATLLAALKLQR